MCLFLAGYQNWESGPKPVETKAKLDLQHCLVTDQHPATTNTQENELGLVWDKFHNFSACENFAAVCGAWSELWTAVLECFSAVNFAMDKQLRRHPHQVNHIYRALLQEGADHAQSSWSLHCVWMESTSCERIFHTLISGDAKNRLPCIVPFATTTLSARSNDRDSALENKNHTLFSGRSFAKILLCKEHKQRSTRRTRWYIHSIHKRFIQGSFFLVPCVFDQLPSFCASNFVAFQAQNLKYNLYFRVLETKETRTSGLGNCRCDVPWVFLSKQQQFGGGGGDRTWDILARMPKTRKKFDFYHLVLLKEHRTTRWSTLLWNPFFTKCTGPKQRTLKLLSYCGFVIVAFIHVIFLTLFVLNHSKGTRMKERKPLCVQQTQRQFISAFTNKLQSFRTALFMTRRHETGGSKGKQKMKQEHLSVERRTSVMWSCLGYDTFPHEQPENIFGPSYPPPPSNLEMQNWERHKIYENLRKRYPLTKNEVGNIWGNWQKKEEGPEKDSERLDPHVEDATMCCVATQQSTNSRTHRGESETQQLCAEESPAVQVNLRNVPRDWTLTVRRSSPLQHGTWFHQLANHEQILTLRKSNPDTRIYLLQYLSCDSLAFFCHSREHRVPNLNHTNPTIPFQCLCSGSEKQLHQNELVGFIPFPHLSLFPHPTENKAQCRVSKRIRRTGVQEVATAATESNQKSTETQAEY